MTKRAGDYMTKKKAANKSNLVNIENILMRPGSGGTRL